MNLYSYIKEAGHLQRRRRVTHSIHVIVSLSGSVPCGVCPRVALQPHHQTLRLAEQRPLRHRWITADICCNHDNTSSNDQTAISSNYRLVYRSVERTNRLSGHRLIARASINQSVKQSTYHQICGSMNHLLNKSMS